MRPINHLVHGRTRVRDRYALMPLEGFPFSRLPAWPDAQVRVLAAPALGAGFVQYLIDLPAGKRGSFPADSELETFFFVLSGTGSFSDGAGTKTSLAPGAFGLVPPGAAAHLSAGETPTSLIVLRKRYEPAAGVEPFTTYVGNESDVKREAWGDNPHSLLQLLIPDEFRFDLAMNIFTFSPGHGLPIVETHVMEHGLYFLRGKGVYYLGDEWMEVEKDDFIWMGPYCPQSFYATGPTPSRYLYYKNVNREIPLPPPSR
jgi:(S)-ureidoglycine aminohydrolase